MCVLLLYFIVVMEKQILIFVMLILVIDIQKMILKILNFQQNWIGLHFQVYKLYCY